MIEFKRFLIAVLAALALAGGHFAQAQAKEFSSSFEVDLQKYKGLWYDTARTPNRFQDNTITKDGKSFGACLNSTANYTVTSPSSIDVLNRCTRRAEDGSLTEETITGIALADGDPANRKLKIAFGNSVARFFQRAFVSSGGFDYWIYCLGAENEQGLYDWAVVSGADKSFIFILTRDQFISDELRGEILACAAKDDLPADELIFTQEKL